jgi:hypothetical protein
VGLTLPMLNEGVLVPAVLPADEARRLLRKDHRQCILMSLATLMLHQVLRQATINVAYEADSRHLLGDNKTNKNYLKCKVIKYLLISEINFDCNK